MTFRYPAILLVLIVLPVSFFAQDFVIRRRPVVTSSVKVAVSDDFNRSSGSLGANWTTNPTDGIQIWSNYALDNGTSYPDLAWWSANSFNNSQFASLTVTAIQSSWQAFGPAVRVSAGNGYGATWHDTTVLDLRKVVGGAQSTIGTTSTVSVGDVIRIEVSGSSITVKKNGVAVIGPVTDTSISSGAAGMYGAGNPAQGDSWAGGDL